MLAGEKAVCDVETGEHLVSIFKSPPTYRQQTNGAKRLPVSTQLPHLQEHYTDLYTHAS